MNPDEIVLNFNPGTLVLLNVVLGLIMLGVASTSPSTTSRSSRAGPAR